MLYERWQEVVNASPGRLALWDGVSGRSHSFRELAKAADEYPTSSGRMQFARGLGVEFILSALSGWRDGKVLVPLEPGQSQPVMESPPAGDIIHLKTTSATTGSSRMIAFNAEQLAADCENVVTSMGLNAGIPNVGAISLALGNDGRTVCRRRLPNRKT